MAASLNVQITRPVSSWKVENYPVRGTNSLGVLATGAVEFEKLRPLSRAEGREGCRRDPTRIWVGKIGESRV